MILTRGGAVWKLVGLITRRSQVQILSPLLYLFVARSEGLPFGHFCFLGKYMSLISLEFFVFFIIIAAVYFLLPGRFQWVWLLLGSLVFYYSFSTTIQFVFFIAIVLINWAMTFFMSENCSRRKAAYISTLVFDVTTLALFKYARFFYNIYLGAGQLFKTDFHNAVLDHAVSLLEDNAPLRISYFALIIIGYITDVYWGKASLIRSPGKVLLFSGYFPQMTSGPIVTLENMDNNLWGEKHRFSYDRTVSGLERVLWGIFKKIVISERCAVIVNRIYGYYEAYNGLYIFVAAAMFAIQLYCDFSGLMDIVLGYSEVLGIILPENFRIPFYSLNLSEFWRRWHITLGGFLRDYVLYPIQRSKPFKNLRKACKNRFGKGYEKKFNLPLYLSLLISWFLIGLWHGGGWNYIFGVGLYMWAVIVIGEVLHPFFMWLAKILHVNTECASYRLFLRVRTFLLFMFGLSFFRAETLKDGFLMWRGAFRSFNPWIFFDESFFGMGLDRREWGILIFALIVLFVVSYISEKRDVRKYLKEQNFVFRLFIFAVMFAMIIIFGYYGASFNAQDFIYGRF